MSRQSTEPDYLAATQPRSKHTAFERAILEAFAVEHNCKTSADIARVIGRDKSRISQIFRSPSTLKAETIQLLLDHIETPEFRQHIVSTWVKTCFGDVLRGRPTAKEARTLKGDALWKHFHKLEMEDRHLEGARLAEKVAESEQGAALYCELMVHACIYYSVIDLPGQAMRMAKQMAVRAVETLDPYMYFAAFELRIRVHLDAGLKTPQEASLVTKLLRQYEEDINIFEETATPRVAPSYSPKPITLTQLTINFALECMKGKLNFGADHSVQEKMLDQFRRASIEKRLSREVRAGAFLSIAEVESFRENKVEVEEALENALRMRGLDKNYNFESALFSATYGLLKKSISPPVEAAEYLHKVSEQCRAANALRLRRDVEYALLEVESVMFPPSHPVLSLPVRKLKSDQNPD